MKFCMLCISGFTFLYVACMCMYDVCIRRLKRVIHTTYRHIFQSIFVCMCMYLHVCGSFFVHVCACMRLYVVHIFPVCVISVLYCMYLPVFLAGKIASRPDTCNTDTYMQYNRGYNRHTYTYIQKYMQIHAKIHTQNKCAKSAYDAY